ncbi:MAG TPA: 50S ribosomal protein P1 [Bacillota bacterium]|nr:50S ribosomal protein P1 [Bacillota bacterium]
MENIYAALLLHKSGKEVNEENLKKVVVATGTEISSDEEAKIKSLVASLKGVDIDKELESAALVGAAPAASAAPAEKKEEKPKEERKETAAEGLSALFG